MGSNLPVPNPDPPETPKADTIADTVAISTWTGDRAIAIGNEGRMEWLVFDGDCVELENHR